MKKGKIIFGLSAVLSTALAVFSVNRGWALYSNTVGSKEFGIQGTYPSTSSGPTPTPEPDKYQKVTSAPASWEGTYLLVYESAANTGYVWTGVDAINCYVSQTVADGVIYADDLSSTAVTLTVASITGGYSIKINGINNNGKYVGKSADSNGMDIGDTEAVNTFALDGGSAKITGAGGAVLRYNANSGQDRFRYYKSSSYANQQAVQLYKFIQGGPVVPIPLESISVTPTSASIETGATLPLEITYNPSNATNKNVSFVSSNTSVATVSNVGLVTAKAVGSTTITVTSEDGNHTATCFVTVSQASDVPVTSVSLSPASVDILGLGNTTTLTPTVYPENATNKNVSFTSSVNSVATVNTSGVVTAVGAGETTVIVKTNDGGFEAESTVHVYKHAGTLTDPFDAEDAYNKAISTGSTAGAKYYVSGVVESFTESFSTQYGNFSFNISANGKTFLCYRMLNGSSRTKFTSSTDIEIGDTVVVYGAPFNYNSGKPEISGSSADNYVVSVTKGGTDPVPVTGVSLPETASISVSSSKTLTPTFTPSNATNKTCTWTTSNSSIATVNNGLVRGVSEGTATITVTTVDGGFTDTCVVTVTAGGGGGDIPEGYYDSIDDSMSGTTLLNELRKIINNSSVSVSYDWSRYQAADEDLNDSDSVLLIYARTTLPKTSTDPGRAGNYWNREHTFPQSKLEGPSKSDNHIIFASDKKVNGTRGDLKLGVISSGGTVVTDNLGRSTPCKYIANTMFDPGDTQARGEVARSTMYAAVMYGLDPVDNIETISRMLDWHNTYGIQARDIKRNQVIYGNQKNRNPFVDHPEYAARIWG